MCVCVCVCFADTGVYDAPHTALRYDMLHRLPFLDCCVREALRLYPAQPCPATVRQIKQVRQTRAVGRLGSGWGAVGPHGLGGRM